MSASVRHVITAMGVTSALGDSVEATRVALYSGRDFLSRPPLDLPFTTVCGVVSGPLDPLPNAMARSESRMARIALRALLQLSGAIEHAKRRLGRDRIGVVVGTSTGGLDATESAYRVYRATDLRAQDFSLRRGHAFDAAAQLVARLFDISGPCYAVSTACTSSAKAIGSALRLLETNVCDAVIVGGADALCETTLRGFHGLGVLSEGGARPFSSERTGTHLGEAGAFFLLERNGDGPVHIASVGESSDAHTMTAPPPDGRGAKEAMQQALARANLHAEDIGYVNAHGTGTVQNDSAESLAIAATFGTNVPVSSTKALTGHTLGACGALEVIITALALTHARLPESARALPLDEGVNIHVLTSPLERRVSAAISNAFAFGGSNAAVLLVAS